MNTIQLNEFAWSTAGHDKGNLYVIMKEESEYVYLVNGENRTLDRPKKKKKKHIQVVHKNIKEILEKQTRTQRIENEDVKRAIKLFQSKGKVKED